MRSFTTIIVPVLLLVGLALSAPAPTQLALESSNWLSLPSVGDIKNKIGVKSLAGPPLVFNVPSYANWTSTGWNLRVHGSAYKPLPLTDRRLEELGQFLMPGYPRDTWTPKIASNVRNMTASLLSLPQSGVNLSFTVIRKAGGDQIAHFSLPEKSGTLGDFQHWAPIESLALQNGVDATGVQTLEMYTDAIPSGNATAYLVPPTGTTLIADVDDILRVTEYWLPRRELINTIGLDYIPWMNMPRIIDGIKRADPSMHFHYVTTTPQPGARKYVEFVNRYYPNGSFDFRPFELSSLQQIFHSRKENIVRHMETFPQRKFILLGDISNSDLVSGYAEMATMFPKQVQCILLRNVTATEPLFALPVNYKPYKNLPPSQYQFFNTPDDLANIDFANGGCRNYALPQDVQFKTVRPSFGKVANALLEGNTPLQSLKAFFNALPSLF